MYTVTHIDKSTKKIKGSREPIFYVSTDMKYSSYKQDKQLQELVNMIWTTDIEQSFDDEGVHGLEDWIEFTFMMWGSNIDRSKIYTRLSQGSYSFTLQIKSNKLFQYATQDRLALDKLLLLCHIYKVTNAEQVYKLQGLPDDLGDYSCKVGEKAVEYNETNNNDYYISYFQFLMLLRVCGKT